MIAIHFLHFVDGGRKNYIFEKFSSPYRPLISQVQNWIMSMSLSNKSSQELENKARERQEATPSEKDEAEKEKKKLEEAAGVRASLVNKMEEKKDDDDVDSNASDTRLAKYVIFDSP